MITVAGIALSNQEAALRPRHYLKSDIQTISATTAGKIFVSLNITDEAPDKQIALKMIFDGKDVEISQNEKGMAGSAKEGDAPFKSYPVDLPMRLVTVQELPHTIQFRIGEYQNEQFIEQSRSPIFELVIPSETPAIDPKVAPEDRD